MLDPGEEVVHVGVHSRVVVASASVPPGRDPYDRVGVEQERAPAVALAGIDIVLGIRLVPEISREEERRLVASDSVGGVVEGIHDHERSLLEEGGEVVRPLL